MLSFPAFPPDLATLSASSLGLFWSFYLKCLLPLSPLYPLITAMVRLRDLRLFLVRTHLDSNPDLATCFLSWPCYLISLNRIFICKMRALLFHYYKDWKRVEMKYPTYLTEIHFLREAFPPTSFPSLSCHSSLLSQRLHTERPYGLHSLSLRVD